VLTYHVPSLYKIDDRRTKEITKHETTLYNKHPLVQKTYTVLE